ncbi:hypothetical protein JTE90_021289 [Oedothorax gibbosus]|uniref:Uncharacterized protein n=1 Tax=Oedothorax gibbosus TaxID=931172 RepID=A0AAV6TS37_9ARAC|nr:hypothetical protein JTE90_021289 [Oedothorax gibbosus]
MELEEISSIKNRKKNNTIQTSESCKDKIESILELEEEENKLQQRKQENVYTNAGYRESSDAIFPMKNNADSETVDGEISLTAVTGELIKNSSIYAVSQLGHSQSNFRRVMWLLVSIGGTYEGYSFEECKDVALKTRNESCLRKILDLEECRDAWNEIVDDSCLMAIMNFTDCRDLGEMGSPYRQRSFSLEPKLKKRTVVSCSATLAGKSDFQKDMDLEFFMNYTKLDENYRFITGYQANELIKECSFNGESCSIKDLKLFQSLRYGNCFTFNKAESNSSRRLMTSKTGYRSGLHMTLDVRSRDYLPTSHTIGARVIVHPSSSDPDRENLGINISPGFETSISLKQSHISRLEYPYQDRCARLRNW